MTADRSVTLATLTLPDGRTFRAANAPASVEVATLGGGGPYVFEPLLGGAVDYAAELNPFSREAVSATTGASIDLVTTDDLGEMQADFYAVTAARVELATIWPGEAWEARSVLIGDGAVRRIAFGAVGQASTFEVRGPSPPTGATFGDAGRTVADDWPAPLTDNSAAPPPDNEMTDLGTAGYQWVLGRPYRVPAYKVGAVGGINRLILAGHPFARTGPAYPVVVYEDGVAVGTFEVFNGTASGGDYAYVVSATDFLAADGAYTYAPTYGGMAGADGVAPALTAADVLRKLLVASGARVDWPRMQPALARLASWPVGAWGDTPANTLDVIRDMLVPVLPIVEVSGGEGMWFAYTDPVSDPVEADLVVGQELLDNDGRPDFSDRDDVRNHFSIQYGLDPFTREYTGKATLGPSTSALCYLSDQTYGAVVDEAIVSDVIADEAAAMRVLASRASRLAMQRRTFRYLAAPGPFRPRAGMKVRLTHESRGVDRHEGVIVRVEGAPDVPLVTIELLDRTPMSLGPR